MKKQFRMEMWTMQTRDQSACSVQSDLDLQCPQKLLVSSTEGYTNDSGFVDPGGRRFSLFGEWKSFCIQHFSFSQQCFFFYVIKDKLHYSLLAYICIYQLY